MKKQDSISLWDESAEERERQTPFSGEDPVDVAVVGGGFTGLSTALHSAQAGLCAHVLEARRIGYGGSGRNVGLVNAGVWLPPKQVRERLGPTYGPRFLEIFGAGPRMVFDLIEKHSIRCEMTKSGAIHAAHSRSGFRDLEAREREWRALGAPVRLLDREEAAELIGSDAFHGGLLDLRAGTVNPMGYCRGLARAAIGAGAKISAGVRVTNLTKDASGWVVETTKGAIKAKAVVLGTNAYTDDLWPGLKKVFTIIHFFQLATTALGDRGVGILPHRQGLWNTAPIMLSIRRDAFNRLIIGSMGQSIGARDRGLSQRWARKWIQRLFPALGPVEFEGAWHGQIAMTPDHLPRIHALDDNLYAPIGYNGRGITTGTIFGKAMSDLLTGMAPSGLPLPLTAASRVTGAPVMKRLYQLFFTANQLIKSVDP